ncbi:MAG: hypothetical protein IKM76_08775 [Prevotella sp.]|nr:hypothetical protein [Prevotella sp.]
MKTYFSIIIALSFLSQISLGQNIRQMRLPYKVDDFSVNENSNGLLTIQTTKYTASCMSDDLYPALPYIGVRILVSPTEDFETVSLSYKDILVSEGVEMAPNPVAAPSKKSPESVLSVKRLPYWESLYPARNIEYTGCGKMGGYKMLSFLVCPFKYYSSEKKLYFCDNLSIRLSTKGKKTTGKAGKMGSTVKNIVINSAETDELYTKAPTKGFEFGSNFNRYQYIIVTNEEFKSSFQRLADWKTLKGVPAKILTTEEIATDYTGSTLQAKIKNALKSYYDSTDEELTYVLLGGDVDIVPAQMCYARYYNLFWHIDETTITPTDLYYGCFDTMNWDSYENGIYGEIRDHVDILPEVYVTRVPVSTTSEADSFINRVISYESNPQWCNLANKILMSGTAMCDTDTISYGNISDVHFKSERLFHNYIEPYWNGTKVKFYDTGTDFPDGAYYDFLSNNIQEQLGNGYGFVHIMTHGNVTSYETEQLSDSYDIHHAAQLNNKGETIIFTTACHTNSFDSFTKCLSESFIRNSLSGVLGYVGSSREGWIYCDSARLGPSNILNGEIMKRMFSESNNNFGKIVAEGKAAFEPFSYDYTDLYRWLQFSVNPIGDPEMPIFTSVPQSFTNVSLTYDNNGLSIDPQVTNCRYCVSGRDNTCYINQEFVNSLWWAQLLDGEYNACITKPGYIPYNQIFSVNHGIYIQNETFGSNVDIVGNDIYIGSNVKASETQGAVAINKGVIKIKHQNGVLIKNDFEVKQGAVLEITQ